MNTHTHNLQTTPKERQRKYQDLAFEMKQLWQLNKITIIHTLADTARFCISQEVANYPTEHNI